jgi:uncharacterized protein YjbI with pentapeptide repeats
MANVLRVALDRWSAPMANDEHVAILKKGVDALNAWRDEFWLRKPDLSGAKLRGADLTGANLTRANLSGADLREAKLFQSQLFGLTCAGRTSAGRISPRRTLATRLSLGQSLLEHSSSIPTCGRLTLLALT